MVGLLLLDKIRKECAGLELGLYRDDGLGITRNLSGPQSDRLKKKLFQIFKSCGLRITIECNLAQADFLDVTFNLFSEKYWPYRKPNNEPLYIHKESNHPPNIIKQLPTMIENRVSATSCDEHEFNKVKDEYNAALKKVVSSKASTSEVTNKGRSAQPVSEMWYGSTHPTTRVF